MRRAYKPLFWRATRPENTADCMNEWKYFLKYNINISIIIRFKQYLPSVIQSIEFTGRVARQNNGLYVLRMIVKLAYTTAQHDTIDTSTARHETTRHSTARHTITQLSSQYGTAPQTLFLRGGEGLFEARPLLTFFFGNQQLFYVFEMGAYFNN